MAQAQYGRLSDDAPLPPADAATSYPPFRDSGVRESFESDGSGSDLVYRDIAEEDPFDSEKQTFSHSRSNSYAADDEDVGFSMEPRRVGS